MASPYRIFYTVIYIVYNLFSGVSVPGASVLGYGLPPIGDSEENSIGGRPYPRTEAPGAETLEKNIGDSVEKFYRGEAIP